MQKIDRYNLFNIPLNRELNELYISRAIIGIALSLISLFIPIYFYQIGFSIGKIIFFFFLIALYFFILILLTPKIISKFGIKHSILFSTPPVIIYYLGLNYIKNYPILFFILPFFIALSESLLWVAYDIYFLKFSKKEIRGSQLSLSYIISILTSIIGPFLGALLIIKFGYNLTYIIGAGLAFFSIIPLFLSKEFKRKLNFNYKDLFKYLLNKKNINLNLSFIGYSIENQIEVILWPIFIFIILKGVLEVGSIVSLTTLISIIIVRVMGKLTDIKNKKYLIRIGMILTFISWFLRTIVNTKLKIFIVDTFKKYSYNTLLIPWVTYTYDIAKKRNYFKYFVARELVFKGTRLLVLPLIILIFYLFSVKTSFILTFIIAGLVTLLYNKIKA